MAAAAVAHEKIWTLLLFEQRLYDEVCEHDAPLEYEDPVWRERDMARSLDEQLDAARARAQRLALAQHSAEQLLRALKRGKRQRRR